MSQPHSEPSPLCGDSNEDKPTSGTLSTPGIPLQRLRARDNTAGSENTMASSNDKKRARDLMKANPGVKYTQALRLVQVNKFIVHNPSDLGTPITGALPYIPDGIWN